MTVENVKINIIENTHFIYIPRIFSRNNRFLIFLLNVLLAIMKKNQQY